jgi:hypothetical protein
MPESALTSYNETIGPPPTHRLGRLFYFAVRRAGAIGAYVSQELASHAKLRILNPTIAAHGGSL